MDLQHWDILRLRCYFGDYHQKEDGRSYFPNIFSSTAVFVTLLGDGWDIFDRFAGPNHPEDLFQNQIGQSEGNLP